MAEPIGKLKSELSLDSSKFSKGVDKARGGLKKTGKFCREGV